ncbi:hypothetical protein PHLCEN_2v7711 [Hermanssonia centrifuga]|uniref:DNA 3'-5' helicase n=1 Tax=Hermanssonia centrifuga TaxID=98765 RepID=A0A2R6NWB9_9APHY|nr:hypothetical protein PHLCEN_2v7711 [Hermanssonia centrifuga]
MAHPSPRNLVPSSGDIQAPSIEDIRARCQDTFGVRACAWQAEFAQAILARKSDVILEVATGMGKTLAFWLPLLFRSKGIQIVITTLNTLGKQCVDSLTKAGIGAVSIDGSLSHEKMAQVFKEIRNKKYRVIIVSPEQLMKEDSHFERLFKTSGFLEAIISFIIDEAHVIKTWGTFRPEYREIERLRYRLRKEIPFALVSATMPVLVRQDISRVIRIRKENLTTITRSTDRPNVHLVVCKIEYALKSFQDLAFIINRQELAKPNGLRPPKFLIFFDNITESVAATKYLWSLIGQEHKPEEKIKWFNSCMSEDYKKGEIEKLRSGELWGLCTTDSFGMGMDLPDIMLIVQYRVTCNLCSLWQRFGRGSRDRDLEATAILLAEAKHFDGGCKKTEGKAAGIKRKRQNGDTSAGSPNKRPTITPAAEPNMPTRIFSSNSPNHAVSALGCLNHSIQGPDASDNEIEMADSELDEADEARQVLYSTAANIVLKNKRKAAELEPAMEDYINAEGRGLGCRRKVIKLYFSSDKTSE